ncbi:unnamed protein product, partial [Cuscuta campestris]
MKVWGCLSEAKLYNPFLKKLDMKTVTCYFIGYPSHSKGYRFYCPSHITRIVETKDAHFLEDFKVSGSSENPYDELLEVQDAGGRDLSITLPPITPLVLNANSQDTAPPPTPNVPGNEDTSNNHHQDNAANAQPDNLLRRSSRSKRPTNFDDYVTYLTEAEMDAGKFT